MSFLRDTRHLWLLLAALTAAGVGFAAVRRQAAPKTYGQQGPYRTAALTEIAARPSVLSADASCAECHQEVHEERAESLHNAVRCVHCHGLGLVHMAEARKAASSAAHKIPPAVDWDGDFMTSLDLYVSKDRKLCLSCHETVVGMPKDFKQIEVAAHLEEMGASDPADKETCFECHGPHNTAP